MKFKPNDIFKKYPDIEDIAIRLEQSENDAREKNKKTNEPSANSENGSKRIFQYVPEHCVIAAYYKEGRWEQAPFIPKAGKENFLKDLAKILETRKPDAIRIEIYKNKTPKSGTLYTKEIFFSEANETTEEKNGLGAMEKMFDDKLEQFKKNPDASNLQIELLRKDFEKQLLLQQHNAEKKDLDHYHQTEINSLQTAIRQRDEYIKELEDDLDIHEGELGSLKAEAQKEKSTPFGEILLSRVLMTAGENLLKHNPKILKIGLGLSDAEIKKIFESDTKELGAAKTESDNSSFSESTSDEFSELDEKHARGIKDLVSFFKQIKIEAFKKVYTINCLLQDPKTALLNEELTDKVLAFTNENKPKE
jgi:hypothetical protein